MTQIIDKITKQGVVEKIGPYSPKDIKVTLSDGSGSVTGQYYGPTKLKVGDNVTYTATISGGNITAEVVTLNS